MNRLGLLRVLKSFDAADAYLLDVFGDYKSASSTKTPPNRCCSVHMYVCMYGRRIGIGEEALL